VPLTTSTVFVNHPLIGFNQLLGKNKMIFPKEMIGPTPTVVAPVVALAMPAEVTVVA